MTIADITAAIFFAILWLGYEPLLKRISSGRGALNHDMTVVRAAWVQAMLKRENRIADSNLMGHLINSASFFASTNLLIIAATTGVLFGGADMLENLRALTIVTAAPDWLVEAKIAVVLLALTRGLLDFIWAIRQLNYCVALLGAAPEVGETGGYGPAMAEVLNPALSAFNHGVRAYYFALAAAAWLASPYAMALAAAAAFALLVWRQMNSEAAHGVRRARESLER